MQSTRGLDHSCRIVAAYERAEKSVLQKGDWLQFGPLALTRAKCSAGSLHDQIVKQWGYIRSYVNKDNRLFSR